MAPLSWLVSINDYLEHVPENTIKAFNNLSRSAEEMGQTYVDVWCRWLAWKVNVMIERKRQQVIRTLYDQYGGTMKVMQAVNVVQKALSDPIGAIGGFLSIFTKPISTIISFVSVLATEVPRLAANLANIAAALPPTPPNPHINYDAFQLRVGSISMGDIIGGPGALKPPEEMFPEPTKPFSKAAFNESFDKAKEVNKNDKVIWKLPKTKEEEEAKKKAEEEMLQAAKGMLSVEEYLGFDLNGEVPVEDMLSVEDYLGLKDSILSEL